MTKRWYHEVSLDWLYARKNYITATDIAKLVPAYKRGIKKDPDGLIPEFAALYCEKATETEPDVSAVGPAARGHICERWAVDAWNLQIASGGCGFFHWDDALIYNGGVCFSPDGLDIAQPEGPVAFDHTEIGPPTEMMEVKSYDPRHHMMCCLKDKMEQDELIQMAVAMIVCDSLEKANLVFFCPGAPISMKVFTYTRDDLKEAEKIIRKWDETCEKCKSIVAQEKWNACYTEDQIYEHYLVQERMRAEEQSLSGGVFLLKE